MFRERFGVVVLAASLVRSAVIRSAVVLVFSVRCRGPLLCLFGEVVLVFAVWWSLDSP